jgi:hypothetical protein
MGGEVLRARAEELGEVGLEEDVEHRWLESVQDEPTE